MNTNKNSYTIIYAAVMVVIVAFLLAFVSSALKPVQDNNVALDKKKQILSALNYRGLESVKDIESCYDQMVTADMIVKADGSVVNDGKAKDQAGFKVDNKSISQDCLPVYVCHVNNTTKYVIPMTGRGLWGGLQTVYGAYFSHEGETAGLGALIAEEKFQDQFKGKHLFDNNENEIALTVVKNGKVEPGKENTQVDGITGATLTSNGVANMVHNGLQQYLSFFKSLNKK